MFTPKSLNPKQPHQNKHLKTDLSKSPRNITDPFDADENIINQSIRFNPGPIKRVPKAKMISIHKNKKQPLTSYMSMGSLGHDSDGVNSIQKWEDKDAMGIESKANKIEL